MTKNREIVWTKLPGRRWTATVYRPGEQERERSAREAQQLMARMAQQASPELIAQTMQMAQQASPELIGRLSGQTV